MFVHRPSTPIVEVLQNRFLDNWLETMGNKQAQIKKERTDAAVGHFYQKKTLQIRLKMNFSSSRMHSKEVIIRNLLFFVKQKFLSIQNHYGNYRNSLK